jgi:hypothetical protein
MQKSRIGDLKSNIKLNRLGKSFQRTYRGYRREKAKNGAGSVTMNERMMNFSFNLDMRGKRGEEALGLVDQFMDNAIMLGYDELTDRAWQRRRHPAYAGTQPPAWVLTGSRYAGRASRPRWCWRHDCEAEVVVSNPIVMQKGRLISVLFALLKLSISELPQKKKQVLFYVLSSRNTG